jgi:hypothetical protein
MQQALTDLLHRRKQRAIAIVLGVMERECGQQVPAMAQQKLRKVILDQFNDLHDVCVDVMGSLDTGEVALNEAYLERLDEIHAAVVGNGNGRH